MNLVDELRVSFPSHPPHTKGPLPNGAALRPEAQSLPN